MANSKMTKAMAFALASNYISAFMADSPDDTDSKADEMSTVVDILNKEVANLAKKKSTAKPTKVQTENVGYCKTILQALTDLADFATISEIQALSPILADISNQKISALIRQLISENLVERTEIKKKAYFKAIG